MIHAREDYNRIQDPTGKIGEDEPVFLIRAKDMIAADVMRDWAERAEAVGVDEKMVDMVRAHANLTEKWQEKNGSKLADL